MCECEQVTCGREGGESLSHFPASTAVMFRMDGKMAHRNEPRTFSSVGECCVCCSAEALLCGGDHRLEMPWLGAVSATAESNVPGLPFWRGETNKASRHPKSVLITAHFLAWANLSPECCVLLSMIRDD